MTTYLSMSYYFWMNCSKTPEGCCDYIKVVILDILFLNWMRIIATVVLNILSVALLPIWGLAALFACCLRKDLSDRDARLYKCAFFPEINTVDHCGVMLRSLCGGV